MLWISVHSDKLSPADVRIVPKQKNIFSDHWDNSLIPSLLTEVQTYIFSFHEAQWSKRKEVILGYFTINKTLKAISQELLAMLKCWSNLYWWSFKIRKRSYMPPKYFLPNFIFNFENSKLFLKYNFKRAFCFKSLLKSMQVLVVYIVKKNCRLNI